MFKTNVMRLLDAQKIDYQAFEYNPDITEGIKIAEALGEEKDRVFKTLVTESVSGNHYVFVIPVAETLDLKAAAKSVNEKSVAMLKQKELLPLTGYIHGGCSPIGMKKPFTTVIDETATLFDTMYVSAGRVGYQIEINPIDLSNYINAKFCNITVI